MSAVTSGARAERPIPIRMLRQPPGSGRACPMWADQLPGLLSAGSTQQRKAPMRNLYKNPRDSRDEIVPTFRILPALFAPGDGRWTRSGSNRLPPQCHCGALPSELRARGIDASRGDPSLSSVKCTFAYAVGERTFELAPPDQGPFRSRRPSACPGAGLGATGGGASEPAHAPAPHPIPTRPEPLGELRERARE